MEIVWEDPPIPDGPFFTRDVYEKHSFGPSIQELFKFVQSTQRNSPPKENNLVHTGASPTEEHMQNARIREDNCDSGDSSMEIEESKGAKEVLKKSPKIKVPFPEPRVPYPCMSVLSKTEQRKYFEFMFTKRERMPLSELLLNKVNNEVKQFMRYLQDVSRICAEDYNNISKGALQYSEEVFWSRLEYIKTLPEVYQIHELTSLTGGKFNPALTLTFEKELLHMGNVVMTDFRTVPAGTVLTSDYSTISSHTPPAKKAKELHASISNDNNAERLCTCYAPHVCLTREALVQLLDNNGPGFRDEWELPVLIKSIPSKDKSRKKTVFIDAPLLKTEVTLRERSHIYHEEALKLSVIRTETKNVFHVMTELPISKQYKSERTLGTLTNDIIDFEVDLSDLETFGENVSNKATNVKKTKMNRDAAGVKSEKAISQTKSLSKNESTHLDEEMDGESLKDKITQYTTTPQSKNCNAENTSYPLLTGDSDDDKLVIADTSPKDTGQQTQCETPSSEFSPPFKSRSTKQKKKAPRSRDQLGEILQMQTAMFTSKPSDFPSQSSSALQDASSASRQSGPTHLHSTSLVKACVSSYLERNPNQEEETGDAFHNVAAPESTSFKKLLSPDLQAATEDECDYECPEKGNVFYKLYSLDELLLMVRTSIDFAHIRELENQNRCVPVNIFPKLEYQLTYGVECLSSSEACQLWTETLLHSSTETYIAHIDALTSRVAMVRKLPDDWIHSISCGFKPSKSLNILHHILQKITRLDEGQYLLRHKVGEPFVNILKAAHGNGRQGVYNLQQIHSDIPLPPTSAVAPWIPVDPSVCLPFHRQHGRVPCTFPPKEFTVPQKGWTPQSFHNRGGQPGKKKPKKKPKRKNSAKSKK